MPTNLVRAPAPASIAQGLAAPVLARKPADVMYIAGGSVATTIDQILAIGDVTSEADTGAMVDTILRDANRAPIQRLTIVGHGSSGSQSIGPDVSINMENFEQHRPQLARLRGHFARNAVVELHGCNVGDGPRGAWLLSQFSKLWGVEVRASVVPQRMTPGFEGTVASVSPGANGASLLSYRTSSLDNFHRYMPFDGKPAAALRSVSTLTSEVMREQSLPWRFQMIRRITSGDMTPDARRAVLSVWESASLEERRYLYFLLEHQRWSGSVGEPPADGVVRELPASDKVRLTALLNGR